MIFTWVSPKAIFDEHGQFKGSFAVVTDITERKQAEEALRGIGEAASISLFPTLDGSGDRAEANFQRTP